ncbi:M24 family metallopeptidase [Leucobacter sp. GX24907]
MRLNNDSAAITEEFGFDPLARLLFTNIRRDSSKIVKPIIAELAEERLLLVRQQETASVLFAGAPRERVRFHSPWVTFDRRLVEGYEVAPNLAALVSELAGSDTVTLAPGIAYAHLQELAGGLNVEVEADPRDAEAVVVYELSEDEVLARFREWRDAGVAFGREFISAFPGLDGIEEYFSSEVDTRFSALAEVVEQIGVAGIYLGAPPNFSEVTARQDSESAGALWVPGTGKVLVIADAAEYGFAGIPVGRYDSRAEAVRALVPGGRLGVEEEWMTASSARALEATGLELVNASSKLGNWRDLRDAEDLPFMVIAARASTYAMENALERLGSKLQAGQESTEAELYGDYLAGIHDFRITHRIPFGIEPYFVNEHASDRTLFPTTPTDAPITAESGCVELDTGVKVTIDGVVVATSDMGRSLPLTAGAAQAYGVLTRVIREQIIPSIRPGVPMSQVHAEALESLTAVRGELEEAGLLEADTDFVSWYQKRNVGHLMGKQESFANELRPGYEHVLRVGDYGAAETPWRFGKIGISTEDLWFIGEDRTFTLTLGQ